MLHPGRPWQAERMPVIVKLSPINDARIMPPTEFDHEYLGVMIVTRVDEEGIRVECHGLTPTGCAQKRMECWATKCDQACLVWIVYDDILNYQRYSYDVVYRHERAHCNGWHHDKSGNTIK